MSAINVLLRRVECTRDLGVYIESTLSFNEHVSNITNAAYRTLGVISRITREFPSSACIFILYFSLIRSKLEFSSVVWNCIGYANQAKIENVQKRFFRIVYDRYIGRSVYYEYHRLLRRCGCSTLSSRRLERDLIFLYKCVHGLIDCSTLISSINIYVPQVFLRVTPTFSVKKIELSSPMNRIQHFYNKFTTTNIDIFDSSVQVFRRSLDNI